MSITLHSERGTATRCTLCMFYQFGQLSTNRDQLLPKSFHEVQFSILNKKHLFAQVGIHMFTENFHFVRM